MEKVDKSDIIGKTIKDIEINDEYVQLITTDNYLYMIEPEQIYPDGTWGNLMINKSKNEEK